MRFGTDIHDAQKVTPNDFGGGLLTYSSTSRSFYFYCEISQHLVNGLVQYLIQTLMIPGG